VLVFGVETVRADYRPHAVTIDAQLLARAAGSSRRRRDRGGLFAVLSSASGRCSSIGRGAAAVGPPRAWCGTDEERSL
jgi:hypothetical protein